MHHYEYLPDYFLLCKQEYLLFRYLLRISLCSDKLFQDTIQDIRFKLYECQIVHNAWGTHAFDWLTRFFRKMDRFFFVRLQFEPAELKFDCTVCGKQYKAGAKVLNVHIPRTGTPLNHDAVIASYREAAEFFADYFQGDPTLIVCNSWLLNPQHEEFLKQDSNILLFAHDYTIIDAFKRISPNEKTNQIILPGFKYIFPSNPSKLDPYTEYNEEIKDNFIKNYYGISPLIEREIKYRENIQELINELKESDKIYIYKLDNKMEYHFIKLHQFNIEPEVYNYLEGIKKYYNDKLNYHIFKQRTNAISQVCNQQINKHKKTLAKLLNDLDTYKDNYLNKEYGDLLFTYIDLGYIENEYFIITGEYFVVPDVPEEPDVPDVPDVPEEPEEPDIPEDISEDVTDMEKSETETPETPSEEINE